MCVYVCACVCVYVCDSFLILGVSPRACAHILVAYHKQVMSASSLYSLLNLNLDISQAFPE